MGNLSVRRGGPKEPWEPSEEYKEKHRYDIKQPQPLGTKQVVVDGCYVDQVTNNWVLLERFLYLGPDRRLWDKRREPEEEILFSKESLGAGCIDKLIKVGEGKKVVEHLKKASENTLTPKQSTILFALAICARCNDTATKKAAYDALNHICRIPTHLFLFIHFCHYAGTKPNDDKTGTDQQQTHTEKDEAGQIKDKNQPHRRGWGRGFKRAICAWYEHQADTKKPLQFAKLLTKYRRRTGWSHRDVFFRAHIKPKNDTLKVLVHYFMLDLRKGSANGYSRKERVIQALVKDVDKLKQRKEKIIKESKRDQNKPPDDKETHETVIDEGRDKDIEKETNNDDEEFKGGKNLDGTRGDEETNKHNKVQSDLVRDENVNKKTTSNPKEIKQIESRIQHKDDFLNMLKREQPEIDAVFEFLDAVEDVKSSLDLDDKKTAELITKHELVQSHVHTGMLQSTVVWKALAEKMPMTALLKSLGKLTALGILEDVNESKETKEDTPESANDVQKIEGVQGKYASDQKENTDSKKEDVPDEDNSLVFNRFKSCFENEDMLKKARIHPTAVLQAHIMYKRGRRAYHAIGEDFTWYTSKKKRANKKKKTTNQNVEETNNETNNENKTKDDSKTQVSEQKEKPKKTWSPQRNVLDILSRSFVLSTSVDQKLTINKRILVAIESETESQTSRCPTLTCFNVAEAFEMLLKRLDTEPNCDVVTFSDKLQKLTTEATTPKREHNCALPMIWAKTEKMTYDVFIIITNNKTFSTSTIHPKTAMERYRKKIVRDAKLIVVSTEVNKYSIIGGKDDTYVGSIGGLVDGYMLHVVGFDCNVWERISKFIKGDFNETDSP